jgi:hypothetical protein
MKISEIEDADKLATKQDLELLDARIEKRIANLEVNLIKWMVGMQAGTITLFIGALYFILRTLESVTPEPHIPNGVMSSESGEIGNA